MKKLMSVLAMTSAISLSAVGAEPVKVGMITTLSGGGASLGTAIRDGFMLAVKLSENRDIEVIIEDDQRKPDLAVQLADRMVQSDKVDVLTGIVWSNLALAVVPSVTAQGKFYLSPNAGPSALAGKGCHENYFNVAWQNDNLHEAAGGLPIVPATGTLSSSPQIIPHDMMHSRDISVCMMVKYPVNSSPNWDRPITPPSSHRFVRLVPTVYFSFCRAAWGFLL